MLRWPKSFAINNSTHNGALLPIHLLWGHELVARNLCEDQVRWPFVQLDLFKAKWSEFSNRSVFPNRFLTSTVQILGSNNKLSLCIVSLCKHHFLAPNIQWQLGDLLWELYPTCCLWHETWTVLGCSGYSLWESVSHGAWRCFFGRNCLIIQLIATTNICDAFPQAFVTAPEHGHVTFWILFLKLIGNTSVTIRDIHASPRGMLRCFVLSVICATRVYSYIRLHTGVYSKQNYYLWAPGGAPASVRYPRHEASWPSDYPSDCGHKTVIYGHLTHITPTVSLGRFELCTETGTCDHAVFGCTVNTSWLCVFNGSFDIQITGLKITW